MRLEAGLGRENARSKPETAMEEFGVLAMRRQNGVESGIGFGFDGVLGFEMGDWVVVLVGCEALI